MDTLVAVKMDAYGLTDCAVGKAILLVKTEPVSESGLIDRFKLLGLRERRMRRRVGGDGDKKESGEIRLLRER